MKKLLILLFLSLFLISSCNTPQEIQGCTAEGKVCPDGSVVGRTGPNCEFEKCPSETGKTIEIKDYKLDITCKTDSDCQLINKELGLSCCYAGACTPVDYSRDGYVAVNSNSFETLRNLNCPSKEECGPAPGCPTVMPPQSNKFFVAQCISEICQKIEKLTEHRYEDPEITQGAYGNVEYGEGDCMPPIVEENRKYSDFNGYIYFIDAVKFMGGKEYTDEDYFEENQKIKINNGYYVIRLEKGNYYAIPNKDSSTYYYISIEENKIIQKDFKFFKCLSY